MHRRMHLKIPCSAQSLHPSSDRLTSNHPSSGYSPPRFKTLAYLSAPINPSDLASVRGKYDRRSDGSQSRRASTGVARGALIQPAISERIRDLKLGLLGEVQIAFMHEFPFSLSIYGWNG